MKLFAKYNRVNIISTIAVMLVTGVIYYKAISIILINQVDKDLLVEQNEVYDYVKQYHKLPQEFQSADQQVYFIPIAQAAIPTHFIDTAYNEKDGAEKESGRGLITSVKVASQNYKVIIVESEVETEDLIQVIFGIAIGVILLLLLSLLLINRLILNRLWQPFYSILKELKLFSLADNGSIPPIDTDIDEFTSLNAEVTAMAARVKTDYKNLKVFVENASHELLTPIAVINSKLDTLIQTGSFTGKQSKLLDDLYNGVSRLNRLNRALLLLVKLENNLESENALVNLAPLVENLVTQYEEIFQDKGITVECDLAAREIYTSHNLFEILLSNLLNNAIRHNHANGTIKIMLTPDSLVIKNTGGAELDGYSIFTRFNKSPNSEGSGLGLTICKQICDNLGFTLIYDFVSGQHMFTVAF